MKEVIKPEDCLKFISDGCTVMIGGFLAVGTPETLIDVLVGSNIGNLKLIANDTAYPDKGVGRLVAADQLDDVIVCHVGTNKITVEKMTTGALNVKLIPQGTLLEQIRAGGAGLGGVLTPTGVGTKVEEEEQVLHYQGRDYILAPPLQGDVALIKAHKADKAGNLIYRKSARNYNPVMATACQTVIAEVDELLEIGDIDPDHVVTPGLFIDYLVVNGEV